MIMENESGKRMEHCMHIDIDKTLAAEEALRQFPVLYLEGAAACGKTTLIRMLCEKHPEVKSVRFRMDEELRYPEWLCRTLRTLSEELVTGGDAKRCLIFENLPAELPAEAASELMRLIRRLPETCRVIVTGRRRPDPMLIKLLWEGKMEILPQQALSFTREEVRLLAQSCLQDKRTDPDPDLLYEMTGGWPGCVSVMLRLAVRRDLSWEELRRSYEVSSYITKEICGSLTDVQRTVLQLASLFPQINVELCREAGVGAASASESGAALSIEETLEDLTRAGFLICDCKRCQWQIAPLFAEEFSANGPGGSKTVRERLRRKLFRRIPFAGISGAMETDPQEESPQACYLRGMQEIRSADAEGAQREIDRIRVQLEQMCGERQEAETAGVHAETAGVHAETAASETSDLRLYAEVYLNLTFASPAYPLEAWLTLLQETAQACAPFGITAFHLYGIDGTLCSCLCGLRDLTALFTGPKEVQAERADLWRHTLGESEWIAYRLARLEHALDLLQEEAMYKEDETLLYAIVNSILRRSEEEESPMHRFGVPALVLECRLQRIRPDEDRAAVIWQLEEVLCEKSLPHISARVEAAASLYAPWCGRPQRLTQYLQQMEKIMSVEAWHADETYAQANETILFCMAKGYLRISQYEKAQRLIRRLMPMLSAGKRSRYLAEVQFMQAVAAWGEGAKTAAVRFTLESFLTTGEGRYVSFYTEYGKAGIQVLQAYIDWMKEGQGGSWTRKKPYVYSNASQMPMQEYLDLVLYQANRRQVSLDPAEEEIAPEQLTMMETALLQDLGQGMTNAQICEAHGLRLTTVKTHLYNLYRKLDVKSRSQAVIKGRERGLLS